ncbi:MAG: putative rane protein [Acidobacteriaceae bacterium]|nr:putative rane protein [Acidobacteriaceae bacterium]
MQAIRMWNLAVAAALCCSPMLAQAPGSGGGQMQQPNQPGAANSPSSMDQQQQQQQTGTSGMNTGPAVDKAFVKKALEGNIAEIEMGKLALQKSNDDQVKQFAQRMVDDHGKMLDELKPVAEQMGVKVPEGPSKGQMKSMDKMKALSGDAFDQAYIKDMVKDHKGDDNDFKMEAQSTQNPQLKQMVMQSDQTIESHLQQIQQLAHSKGTQKAKM